MFFFPYVFLFSIKENKLVWGFPAYLFLHKKSIFWELSQCAWLLEMQHENNLQAVSIGRQCLTRLAPGQHKSRLVKWWMLSERKITDWSGLHKVLRGFIGRFSLKTTRRGKFSAWIDSSGSWKSLEKRTSSAQAKQSHHFSCCLIGVLRFFSPFPIWQHLYGLGKSGSGYSSLKMLLSLTKG